MRGSRVGRISSHFELRHIEFSETSRQGSEKAQYLLVSPKSMRLSSECDRIRIYPSDLRRGSITLTVWMSRADLTAVEHSGKYIVNLLGSKKRHG